MNRTVILGGIMISLIVFWLIGFVNTLHDDVDVVHRLNKKDSSSNKSYTTINSYGDEVLSLNTFSMKEKKRLWNNSNLKIEMLQLFPHFIEMKTFVEEHIKDDGTFKDEILTNIENVEFEYIGGSMSAEKAKSALSNF
jgi:hypothetical protein